MAGVAILSDEVRSDTDLFRPGPGLSQSQVADLTVGLGCLQPTLAEPPFEASRLELLFEEVDLTAEGLTLLVHGSVPIDFCHKTPVVDGELVELAAEGGVGGSASPKGCDEPGG